ncbi:SCF ubiquitin ligase complex subunit cdc4 [Stygiomarasmius scandens]|uniref:SCF ubiquitin ligase complex subunit cdc4 n=1 Tax=Marasmiellus scandens TaxID=2682957 RepID=A0ABR1K155_9AGAR
MANPQIVLQPSVNTTTVVTTTTTTTTYAPIPLPSLPPPAEPKDPKNYPLLNATLPPSLRHFPLTFPGGARAIFSDGDDGDQEMHDEHQLASGNGWRMLRPDHEDNNNSNVFGLAEALERYGKKRQHDEQPTPRKKQRVPAAPPSPPPESIWPSAPPSPPPQQAPFQPDLSLTTLLTLPSLVNHFVSLPPQLQSHLLLTLLRHSPLPVLRTLHSVLTPTLARDFLTLLPPELVSHVLSFLPFPTLVRASRVSKAWRAIIDSDPVLWRDLLKSTKIWFGGESENAFAASLIARRRRRYLNSPPLPLPLPHPYKILFKSRHLTRTKWVNNPDPRHISFPAHGHSVVTCLIFSHGRIISASDDHSIHVYSPLTGKLEKKLEGHEGGVWALAASGDVLVSGSTDRTVRIWDLKEGGCKHVFGGHTSTVRCLAVVKPEMVDVYDDETGLVIKREKWPKRPLIVTGSRDHSLRVWTLPKRNEPEYKTAGYDQPNGSTSPGADDAEVCDVEENPYHRLYLEGHDHAVRALAARGRTLVSGSYDCTVRIWDIITGKCRWVLVGHTQKVYSVVLDPSRNQACSGSMDGTVRIWSILTGTCLHTLTGHTSLVGLLGLSPSYLVSAAADSTLRIWDPSTGALKHTLAAHTGAITCFQHDEFKVLSGSDGTLKMWDVREGGVVRDLLVGITGVWQVAFEGRWCVSASNRSDVTVLDVWDFGRTGGSVPISGGSSGVLGQNGNGGDTEDEQGGASGSGSLDSVQQQLEGEEEDNYVGDEDWVGEPPGGMYDEEWDDEDEMYEGEEEDTLAPKFKFNSDKRKGKGKDRGLDEEEEEDKMDVVVEDELAGLIRRRDGDDEDSDEDVDASMIDTLSPRPTLSSGRRTPSSRGRTRSRSPRSIPDEENEEAGTRTPRDDEDDEEQDPIEVEVELIPQSHGRASGRTTRYTAAQRTQSTQTNTHHRTRATSAVVTRRGVSAQAQAAHEDAEMESIGGGDDDSVEGEGDTPSPGPSPGSALAAGSRRTGNSTRDRHASGHAHGHGTRKRWI